MPLTGKQARHLRALAHHLKPVVQVGNAGVSDPVVQKVDFELEHHELIKVKVAESGPEGAKAVAPILAERTRSEVAQIIGRTILLYRARKEDPTIVLPAKA